MGVAAADNQKDLDAILGALDDQPTEWDQQTYLKLVSRELTPDEKARILEPAEVYARQTAVLATHWHPESIPMELIRRRIDATFPNRRHELIIPTQHNVLVPYDDYAGVEVDCYSPGFNRKVQLLVHFDRTRLDKADIFKAMLAHTFRYRSRQLFEFIDTLVDPTFEERLEVPAAKTGADENLIRLVRTHALRLRKMLDRNESVTPPDMIKNKLLAYYFDALRDHYDDRLVNHAQMFLRAVKKQVKAHFSLEYFYTSQEMIEEIRGLGGGIVIPHPEQFWPILLAEYHVDGIEVWNPQSREYTEFLINVVDRQNKTRRRGRKPLLIFMGDDCHMGEKARDPRYQDPAKAGREIGVQAAWDDLAIRKSLIVANADRRTIIEEYRARLSG